MNWFPAPVFPALPPAPTVFEINRPGQWTSAAVIALAVWAAWSVLQRLALARQPRAGQEDAAPWRRVLRLLLERTRSEVVAIVGIRLGVEAAALNLLTWTVWLERLVVVAVIIQLGLWGEGLLRLGLERLARARPTPADPTTSSYAVLRLLGRLALWSLLVLLGLQNLGYPITPLIAGLGVGGLAVALAAQNVLRDLFASLAIVLDRPFEPGQSIAVGDLTGSVESVGLKTTRLRASGGEQIVMPNDDLLARPIRNLGRMRERRVSLRLGVAYETPPAQLEQIPALVEQVVAAQPQVRFERAHLVELGDYAIIYEIVYTVLAPELALHLDTRQRILLELLRRLDERGIALAYPTQTIRLQGGAQTLARD